jgi:hypothetical protein
MPGAWTGGADGPMGEGGRGDREPPDARPAEPGAPASPLEQFVRTTVRQVRRLVILLVGTTVVLVGLIMLVTPGPAFVVVPIGLAILAIEFTWARRLLRHVRERAAQVRDDYRNRSR